jgi:hypothetical protein
MSQPEVLPPSLIHTEQDIKVLEVPDWMVNDTPEMPMPGADGPEWKTSWTHSSPDLRSHDVVERLSPVRLGRWLRPRPGRTPSPLAEVPTQPARMENGNYATCRAVAPRVVASACLPPT